MVLLIAATAAAAATGCGDDSSPTAPNRAVPPLNQVVDTADITFYMSEGDSVNTDYQQAYHEWAVPYLGIVLPQRLRYFKYRDNDHMTALTGQPYGSWADVEQYAIHSVERQQGHEAAHCYSRAISWSSNFFTEGIAVALDLNPYTGADIEFFGAPVHDLCRGWLLDGTILPLRDIIEEDDFMRYQWSRTYSQSGSFTRFLIAEFGLETWKEVFRAVDERDSTETILAKFESVYGIPLQEAERRWHDFLRGM
jgi:hypothetical protein